MYRSDFCRLALLTLIAMASGCGFEQLLSPSHRREEKETNGKIKLPGPAPPEAVCEAMFYELLEDGQIQCGLCFHNCLIPPDGVGFCQNRKNVEGTLHNLVYGKPSAVQFDPVEKEPLHHYLPGTEILCIGTVGCNFRCKFCHNWTLSQQSLTELGFYHELEPEAAVQRALDRWRVPSISFTYNEPTVFYEYVYDIAKLAVAAGVGVVIHSNGAMNPKPLRKLLPHVSAMTVDLKAFTNDFYRDVSQGDLEQVLASLKIIRDEGVWLELVNLVIPGLNDDPEDIKRMCHWIVENLGPDTPLHFSRFFPAYRLTRISPTPVETLEAAHSTARAEGLHFASIGNVPGHLYNSTFCPDCGEILIKRVHFTVHDINMEAGKCRFCHTPVPGVWQ